MNENNKAKTLIFVGAAVFLSASVPAPVSAAGQMPAWSIGVGGAYSSAVYKETSAAGTALPIIGYEGEHLYLQGTTLGYALNPRDSQHNIILHLEYDMSSFDPDDSDNTDIKKLDEREGTVFGGVTYQYKSDFGTLKLTGAADIADEHNGWFGDITLSYPIRNGGWGITPSVGYSYFSGNYNQHLYGVTTAESVRTGGAISEFNPGGEGQYSVGISTYYSLTESLLLNAMVTYTNLEGEVEESPILERTAYTSGMVNLIYMF